MARRASGIPGRSMSFVPKMSMVGGEENPKDKRITINCGGVLFETFKTTLKNIPDTRLSWLTESRNAEYDPTSNEYFFDRHPGMFNMILNYYRTGKLHAPSDVCGPLFEEELAFWGIDEKEIEPCCWMNYRTHRDAEETLADFEGPDNDDEEEEEEDDIAKRFGIEEDEGPSQSKWERLRPQIWATLDDARSSRGAKVVAVISLVFVLVSITTFCCETHLLFRIARNESEPINPAWNNSEKNEKSVPQPGLEVTEFVCIIYFTIEITIRFIFCPSKLDFIKVTLNWVDVFSTVPFYVRKITILVRPELEHTGAMQTLKSIGLIRIFRIFKLTRHFSGLKILVHTIKASAKELLLLIMFLFISILIFAVLIYYAESVDEDPLNGFKNIPVGFWWAIVTMTTLGYGDFHPRTGLGYLVGGVCALAGVLVLALPVPVIVNNFALYYGHAQARMKLPKKKKKILLNAADVFKGMSGPAFEIEDENEPQSPTSPPSRKLVKPAIKNSVSPIPKPIPSPQCVIRPQMGKDKRKGSEDSLTSSEDSGIKTGDSNESNESATGISVIFTDDVVDSPRVSPLPWGQGHCVHRQQVRVCALCRGPTIKVEFTDEVSDSSNKPSSSCAVKQLKHSPQKANKNSGKQTPPKKTSPNHTTPRKRKTSPIGNGVLKNSNHVHPCNQQSPQKTQVLLPPVVK